MQISRHWRLNPQRYRLEGFRSTGGEVSLQNRPSLGAFGSSPETVESVEGFVASLVVVSFSGNGSGQPEGVSGNLERRG